MNRLQLVTSRNEARVNNQRFFWTGNPCKHGHNSVRTLTDGCLQCKQGYTLQRKLREKVRFILYNKLSINLYGYPATRKYAHQLGYPFYYSGPCSYGHYSVKYTPNGKCFECCNGYNNRETREQKSDELNEKHMENTGYPINAQKAKELGYSFYFTGVECKRGHLALRRISTKECLECEKVNSKKWKANNPDKVKSMTKDWYARNREEQIQQCAQWREENREYHRQLARNYRKRNLEAEREKDKQRYWDDPEKERQRTREYQKRNPIRVNASNAERKARKLQAIANWVDLELIRSFYENCPEDYDVDHIIPLYAVNKNGTHVACGLHCLDNLQYLTIEENRSKSNRNPDLANNLIDDDNQGAA